MNAMTKVAKMLALMPVVALAAACNGVAPTTSTDFSTDATTDSGQATSMGLRGGCPGLIDVTLETVSEKTMLWVEATYHFDAPPTPANAQCAAPSWTADRRGLVVDRANRFRAGFSLSGADVVANVTAVAPNRVSRTIKVDSRIDATSPSPQTENACKFIEAVELQVVPVVTSEGTVNITSTYRYSQITGSACTVAPEWSANRKGLVVARDGFRASIERSDTATAVFATAPNGVQGVVRF